MGKRPPSPGSRAAVKVGCTCPVMDNAERPDEYKVCNADCPMHGNGMVQAMGDAICGVKPEAKESFAGGATRSNSAGKGRYDLISPIGLKRLALRYEGGAAVHGDRNWESGVPVSRCLSSAIRHIFQHLAGLRDEDHLGAAAWNVFAAMHFQDTASDDLPKGGDA